VAEEEYIRQIVAKDAEIARLKEALQNKCISDLDNNTVLKATLKRLASK
jgi:hypothetical protein